MPRIKLQIPTIPVSIPLRVYPRPGYDGPIDGPQRFARGPNNHEGLGRERYRDQSDEERKRALSAMVEDAGLQLNKYDPVHWNELAANRQFAKGWLAESERVKSYRRQQSKK